MNTLQVMYLGYYISPPINLTNEIARAIISSSHLYSNDPN